jgi:catechol-2,3-dioxygenase
MLLDTDEFLTSYQWKLSETEKGFRRTIAEMIRIGTIVLRVDDLRRQTEFWEEALA